MKLISKQQLEEKASVEGTDQDSASEKKKKREREWRNTCNQLNGIWRKAAKFVSICR